VSTPDGRLVLDEARRVVERDGRQLALSRLAFDLLAHLVHRFRRAVRRQEILEQVWGFATGATATITVHVGQLRRTSEDDPSRPVHLRAVRGVGYRFDPQPRHTGSVAKVFRKPGHVTVR
jgi:two-component system response regulator ResD